MKLPDRLTVIYALLAVLAAGMLLPLLLVPLNSDNDTYQAMALAMDRGRGLPYLGSWDQNFPGVVFYHWLSIKLFGLSDVAFRIVDLLNQLSITLITFAIARRYVSLKVAWVVVPLSIVFYLGYGFWMLGQRDAFATTWLLLALYLLLDERRITWHLLIAGAAIALATFIRPTLIVFAALVFVGQRDLRLLLRDVLMLGTGLVGTLVIAVLPWVLTPHGMREFVTATILFNREVYGPNSREPLLDFFHVFTVFTPFYVLGLIALCITLYAAQLRRLGITVVLYFACGAIGILAMAKFHVYHYAIYLPILGLLIAIGIDRFIPEKWKLTLSVLFVIVTASYYYPRQAPLQFVKGGMSGSAYERIANNIASYPELGREQESDVIHYLQSKKLQPSDVEFFLLWPGLQWRSGFVSDSRFTTTFALSMEGSNGQTEYQREWLYEVTQMLQSTRPRYVVSAIGPSHVFMFSRFSSDSLLHCAQRLRDVIRENYELDTAIAGFRVYRSRNADH